MNVLRREVKASALVSDTPEGLFDVRTCVPLTFFFQLLSSLCLEDWHVSDLLNTLSLYFGWVQVLSALFSDEQLLFIVQLFPFIMAHIYTDVLNIL